jgi:predicted nucleotide-binding protein
VRYRLGIYSVDTPQSAFDRARESGVQQAIAILEAAKVEVEVAEPKPTVDDPTVRKTVFVVHGRDEACKHETARFLARLTGHEPMILHEQANEGRTIIEKFEDHAADAGYAVVLLTADDVGHGADESTDRPRARQNVVFELGFFFGALGRRRVAMVYEANVERPSDTDGIVRIPLDEAGGWKLTLTRELDAAGIPVDWSALASA